MCAVSVLPEQLGKYLSVISEQLGVIPVLTWVVLVMFSRKLFFGIFVWGFVVLLPIQVQKIRCYG